MNRQNAEYVDQLYLQYIENPESVDQEWKFFFQGVDFGKEQKTVDKGDLDVFRLVQAYRQYGHRKAKINPLPTEINDADVPQLELSHYNLSNKELKKVFAAGEELGLKNATLEQIIEKLQQIYCGPLAIQVPDGEPQLSDWFANTFEKSKIEFDKEKKQAICYQLIRTESLEKFFHTRFVAQKRFSIEGSDNMIPMLEHMVESGVKKGVEEIVIGMAHRGRINVLANFMDKGLDVILAEFTGVGKAEKIEGFDGDVKYHMGYSADKTTADGTCHISLAFNPSHLEAVNPVVLGMTRAKQRVRQDSENRGKVVPVLVHGDAAFAGQGVVAETLQLSQVKGYTVGGTVHIILDNQVGFTTSPIDARSSIYSSDMAKVVNCPVLHVNGDDAEACVKAMEMALSFRQEFKRDIVIHMVCYRRYGHNESDEPAFTQPLMYDFIKKHPTPMNLYGKQLMDAKVIEKSWYEGKYQEKIDNLQKILEDVRENPPTLKQLAFSGLWEGLRRSTAADFDKSVDTKCNKSMLLEVAKNLTSVPEGFNIHKKVKKLLETRHQMAFDSEIVDWGMAELLCYGSLIKEGTSVRISGQDCGRGTFTHRHCVYHDTKTGEKHIPLKELSPDNEFCVYDSILSEMAVVGFEYGNAIVDPTFLTIWEAQFGDFANGAQIMIDQFISSGEAKWQRMCGLVFLLPHGYEGQGPEHSSARLERFLQMCAQYNIQVANLTTPSQLFHVLRRQVKREFRKPLVIMSPKSLLRHPKVKSTLDSLATGVFQEVIDDVDAKDAAKVTHLLFCSGKVYYDLLEQKEQMSAPEKYALIRVEQLYPFPGAFIEPLLKRYKKAKTLRWVQEEPMNMGAWSKMQNDFNALLKEQGLEIEYVGRTDRASPATGTPGQHKDEQQQLIHESFA